MSTLPDKVFLQIARASETDIDEFVELALSKRLLITEEDGVLSISGPPLAFTQLSFELDDSTPLVLVSILHELSIAFPEVFEEIPIDLIPDFIEVYITPEELMPDDHK